MEEHPKSDENQKVMSRPKLPRKRFYTLLGVVVAFIVLFFIPGFRSFAISFFRIVQNPDELQETIRHKGPWAPFLFIFIQTLQVVIAPIPGNVTTMAGGLLFGPVLGFLYGSIGLILGSSSAFFIARFYGTPFVIKFAGKENYEKYSRYLTKKSQLALFLLFLLPFFPDDMLCILAGISSLSYGTFLLFVIFARLPGVYVSVFIGNGTLKLPVWAWIIIGVFSLALVYVSARYGDKIQDAFLSKMKKKFKR